MPVDVRDYLIKKYGMRQPDPTKESEFDDFLTSKEDELARRDQPTQFPDARPIEEAMQPQQPEEQELQVQNAAFNPDDPRQQLLQNNIAPGESGGIPEDVPLEQAQVLAKEDQVPMPQTNEVAHVNDHLKAADNKNKEQAVQDQKLQETDPIEFIKRKYGLGPKLGMDKLEEAQSKADRGRMMATVGEDLLEAGYKAKNLDMPKDQRDYYNRQRAEADIPVQQLKERQDLYKADLDMQSKGFTMEKSGMDMTRAISDNTQDTDPTSIRSQIARAVAEKAGMKVPPSTTYRDLDPVVKDLKSFVKAESANYQLVPVRNEKGEQVWRAVNKSDPTQTMDIGGVGRNVQFKTDSEGNINAYDPTAAGYTSAPPPGANRVAEVQGQESAGSEAKAGGLDRPQPPSPITASSSIRKPVDSMTPEEKQGFGLTKQMRTDLEKELRSQEYSKVIVPLKQAKVGLNRVKANIELAKKGNPLTREQLKTLVAKVVLGEVGNLAAHDKDGVSESKSLVDTIDQAVETMDSGNLSPENIKYLDEVITQAEASLNSSLENEYNGWTADIQNRLSIPRETLDKTIGSQSFAQDGGVPKQQDETPQQQKTEGQPSGTVVVKSRKTGKQKRLSREEADKYLASTDFEEVK